MAKRRKPKDKPPPDLIRRHRALLATQKEFQLRDFELGVVDCLQLARFHLVKMGHRGLPKPPPYSTASGVKKALAGQGAKDLAELLDKHLPRIAPAAMLPGDLALVKAQPGAAAWRAGTVVISVGRKFLGWHPDHAMLAILEPTVERPFIAAWRA